MRKWFLISAVLLVAMAGLTVGLVGSQPADADAHSCCRNSPAGVLMFAPAAAEKKCANTRQPNSRCVDRCRKDMVCSTGSAGTKGTKGKGGHHGDPDKGGTPGKGGAATSSCPCKKV